MVLSPMDQCMEIDAQGREYCSDLGVVCLGLDFLSVFLLCCACSRFDFTLDLRYGGLR